MTDVFSFKINKDEVVRDLQNIIGVSENLDDNFKDLAQSVNKVSFNKPIKELNDLRNVIKTAFSKENINFSGIDAAINSVLKDGDKLKQFVNDLKKQLGGLKGDEFKQLSKSIEVAENALESLNRAQQGTRQQFVGLRKQTGDLNNEQLAQAGKLKDAIGDQQQQIRILASDTKALDFGVSAISLAANGYQALTGAMQLFGVENEDALKSIQKLQALMALTNALREIQNALLAEGTLRTLGNAFATKGAAVAQSLYTAAVSASSTALGAFKLALIGTGIGAAVVLIGYLITKYMEYSNSVKDASNNVKLFNAVNEEAAKNSAKEIARLNVLKAAIENVAAPMKTRLEAVQNLRKEFPKYFKDLSNEALLTGSVANAYNKATEAIIKKAKANAAQKEIENIITENLKTELEIEGFKKKRALEIAQSKDVTFKRTDKFERDVTVKKDDFIKAINERYDNEFALRVDNIDKNNKKIKQLTKYIFEDETFFEVKEEKKKAEAKRDATKSEQKKEIDLITAHANYVTELLNKINTNIDANEKEYIEKRIQKTTETTERELQAIRVNSDIKKRELNKAYNELKTAAEFEIKSDTTNKFQKQELKETLVQLTTAYNNLSKEIEDSEAIEIANVKYKQFETTLKTVRETADRLGVTLELQALNETIDLNNAYNRGEINYEAYQVKLTELNKKYSQQRLKQTIDDNNKELSVINNKLLSGGLSPEQVAELNKRKDELKKSTANATKELTTPENITGTSAIQPYKDFYSSLLSTAIDTYNAINEAEQRAYDKSIQLQQRRLDRAMLLAERGNNEYLELEQQRLTELEQQREQSARRQLQVNQAIQASQILTAVTGAAAKISEGGTANVLQALATIFSAIGAGATLIAQNNDAQPSFYSGVDAFKGIDKLSGSTTTPHNAVLHGQETVIQNYDGTADRYRPILMAIRRNIVPHQYLNDIATRGLNYTAINNASKNHNDRQNVSINLKTLEGKMDKMAAALASIRMNVNYDKRGLSAALQADIEDLNRMKNA